MYELLNDIKRDLFFKDEDGFYKLYENSWDSFEEYCRNYHMKKSREMMEKYADTKRFMDDFNNTYLWRGMKPSDSNNHMCLFDKLTTNKAEPVTYSMTCNCPKCIVK